MANELFRTSVMLPNGKHKWIRSKSKEGLEQKKKEVMLQIGTGLDVLDNSTFGEYAEVWFNVYKKPYLRQKSLEALRNALNNHIYPFLRDVPLKKVSPMQIQLIVASLAKNSKSLNDKVIQILRGVFNAAVDNNLIAKSPVPTKIESKGVRTKEKTALTADQSKRLLDAVSSTRAYLFCLIALQTGMRRGEICGLMWEDVDLDKQIIHVRHNAVFTSSQTVVSEALKTSAAVRDIPIPPTLLDTLKGLKSSGGSWRMPFAVINVNTAAFLFCIQSRSCPSIFSFTSWVCSSSRKIFSASSIRSTQGAMDSIRSRHLRILDSDSP